MAKLVDCFDLFVFGCLKHMIQVFVLLSVVSLCMVGVILSQDEAPPDKYEIQVSREMTALEELVKTHPVLFGLQQKKMEDEKNLAKNGATEIENDEAKVANKNKYLDLYKDSFTDIRLKGTGKSRPVVLHPLFVDLQMKSPLNTRRANPFKLKDHEYDQLRSPLSKKKFYTNYVSKSLPCVLRNEIEENEIFQEMKKLQSKKELDKYLEDKFSFTMGKFVNHKLKFHYTRLTHYSKTDPAHPLDTKLTK